MGTTNPRHPRPPKKTDSMGNHLFYDASDSWSQGTQVYECTSEEDAECTEWNDDFSGSFSPVGESPVTISNGVIQ